MMSDTTKDKFLLSAIQKGDRKAFDMLFRRYYIPLCAYSHHFVGLEDAKEVVQDVMLWIWENRETQNIDSSFSQYIFKAVYHRSLNIIIQNEIRQRAYAVYSKNIQSIIQEIDVCQLNDLSKRLKDTLEELLESYRKAFIMSRFKNMTYKEIALLLDVSPKTVDYRIQQALKVLRVKLKDFLPLILLIMKLSSGKVVHTIISQI